MASGAAVGLALLAPGGTPPPVRLVATGDDKGPSGLHRAAARKPVTPGPGLGLPFRGPVAGTGPALPTGLPPSLLQALKSLRKKRHFFLGLWILVGPWSNLFISDPRLIHLLKRKKWKVYALST